MNIQEQLKAFEKTDKFKKLVAEKMKSDSTFGASLNAKGSKEFAVQYGEEMRKALRDEILPIQGKYSHESFLDYIVVSEEFITGVGWTIDVSFDENKMHRESLFPEKYPDGVLLNEIYNEGYSAKDYVCGTDRHGVKMRSQIEYQDHDKLYFIQRAVDKFNTQYKGKAIALYNSKYTGGTL